ncbi:MAG TPA: nucleoside-diphosphate sugar epimerase, partial [Salinimicrobium sp.]|nr:nucleoside-diphosphate sugar epimerase [Salinimicrobium sp.]
KGEMERDVLKQKIPQTYFFQPSLIAGDRKENRPFEYAWKKVMKLGDHLLLGHLKKYKSIHPSTIAKAMVYVGNNAYSKTRIESDEIKEIAKRQ